MKHLSIVAVLAGIPVTLALVLPGSAQDKQAANTKAPAVAPTAAEAQFSPRLPDYYGQVGLSRQQRETVYAIQKKYWVRLHALRKQIEALETERDKAIYNVLSDRQKQDLARRLREAEERRERRRRERARRKAVSAEK